VQLADTPSAFVDVLTSAAETVLNKSRIDAEVFAAANANRYWSAVLELVQEDQKSGLIPFCDVVDRNNRLLRNPRVPLNATADSKLKRTGALLSARPEMLKAIDSVNDREFEALGCFAARLIGAQRDHITPAGNEGGIDFLAIIRPYSRCHVFSSLGREFRVVGQSKQYASKVQVGAVDQFIKTVENVRHRSDRVDGVIPAWFHASSGPIVGWMVAHNGFQTGGKDEAKKHGIVLSDSRDIAEIVTLSRHFSPNATSANRVSHLVPRVQALLAEFP
jgi:hypothetical protein